MTPGARYAAAIEVLDLIQGGHSAEQVLTTWARQNRYAGSKDRAAIRDHVFGVLRRKRSAAALGNGDNGRALVLGFLRARGIDPETVFGTGGYAPVALSDSEKASREAPLSVAEKSDLPEWLWPIWVENLGDNAVNAAVVQKDRAPITLRVNLSAGSRAEVQAKLLQDGVETIVSKAVSTALHVTGNERRIGQSRAFLDGDVELQDAASQKAMHLLQPYAQGRVLDYCAGGGGKALALADLSDASIFAHDIAQERMKDIEHRARRANQTIKILTPDILAQSGTFDLVLCDAPCSGSGTWRRTPDEKWRLTADRLTELNGIQADVIRNGANFVGLAGVLAYATCSVLKSENEAVVTAFLSENPDFELMDTMQLLPESQHDGFYLAVMRRA